MIRSLALAVLFTSGSALAQTAASPVPEITPPKADGPEHNCTMVDRALLERSGGELLAILAYKISNEGKITNLAVTKSTGSVELDNAFVECVGTWHYKPATKNGEAIEVPWVIAVTRKLIQDKVGGWIIDLPPDAVTHKTLPVVRPELGPRHLCKADVQASRASLGAVGITRVSFIITRVGTVKDVTIKHSDARYSLDDKSISCASQWHYIPATENGFPTDSPWMADIQWTLH